MSTRRAVPWTIHLRRRTTTGQWLPEIDGLRFIAIASVLLFHLQGQLEHHYAVAHDARFDWLMRGFDFGNRGVQLFFVLSGFILALPFARARLAGAPAPSLGRYYLRRVTRLEPPYLVNLALVAAGAMLADHTGWRQLLPHLAASATYLHYAIFQTPSAINSVAWSLEVEVQFYLLAPLLSMVFAVRSVLSRRALLLSAALASALLQGLLRLSQFTLAGEAHYFLAGLLLADLYLNVASVSRLSQSGWDLVSLVGWPVFFLLGDRWAGAWMPVLALLLCLAALHGRMTPRILRTPAIAITGGMCYTIYLWHAPVFTAVDRLLRQHAGLLPATYGPLFFCEALIKTAAVALVCVPLFALVERPCMDQEWPRKLMARLRGSRSSAMAAAAS